MLKSRCNRTLALLKMQTLCTYYILKATHTMYMWACFSTATHTQTYSEYRNTNIHPWSQNILRQSKDAKLLDKEEIITCLFLLLHRCVLAKKKTKKKTQIHNVMAILNLEHSIWRKDQTEKWSGFKEPENQTKHCYKGLKSELFESICPISVCHTSFLQLQS